MSKPPRPPALLSGWVVAFSWTSASIALGGWDARYGTLLLGLLLGGVAGAAFLMALRVDDRVLDIVHGWMSAALSLDLGAAFSAAVNAFLSLLGRLSLRPAALPVQPQPDRAPPDSVDLVTTLVAAPHGPTAAGVLAMPAAA